MIDDVEQLLGRLTPRGVATELRPKVLAAVASQLRSEPASPWLRRCAIGVAAMLLVGIVLNVWASQASERRLAELFGPPPVSKQVTELASMVETATDSRTAQWVRQRFASRRPRDGLAVYMAYQTMLKQIIAEFSIISKGSDNESPQEDSEVDRSRPGRAGGDRSGCQRSVRLDHRCTA